MDEDVGKVHLFKDGLVHVAGALDFFDAHATGEFGFHRACDDAYVKAVGKERRGDCNGGFSAATVADVAHRVNGFFGAAGGDENAAFAYSGCRKVLQSGIFKVLGGARFDWTLRFTQGDGFVQDDVGCF